MRTTIEISDRQRAILLSLAAQRGLRGYSEIINEALELYIASQASEGTDLKEKVLAMQGSWRQEETEQTRANLGKLREKWNIS
ncbi:MAG: hypothetical protein AB9866_05645 [Syntrophobacteraceae bacterium]